MILFIRRSEKFNFSINIKTKAISVNPEKTRERKKYEKHLISLKKVKVFALKTILLLRIYAIMTDINQESEVLITGEKWLIRRK